MAQKISDCFNIDLKDLCDKSEENDYWESCHKFYIEVQDKERDDLTIPQLRWLEKIEGDLN